MQNKDNSVPQATENTISFNLKDSYFDDEFIYPQYIQSEDIAFILPTEEDEAVCEASIEADTAESLPSHDVKSSARKISPEEILRKAVDIVYSVGDDAIELFKWLLKKTGPFILLPFAVLSAFISKALRNLRKAISEKPSGFKNELKTYIGEEENKSAYIKAFILYLFKGKRLLKSAVNLTFPLIAIVIVMNVYGNFKDSVYALEVLYNGKSIGFVEDKKVFEDGKKQALTLLSTGIQQEEQSIIAEPVYKVKRVAVNELSNSGMVSESIISSSDISYVRACGIYIDGVFLCAVKNESDALTVFETLLEPYIKKAGSTESVAFVEEIEYVQGLYPENSDLIWSPTKLLETLSNPISKAKYHKFKKGDTVKKVAKKYGLTVAQLKALNPKKNFKNTKKLGKLLVARQESYVRIKFMRTRIKTQTLPFETIKKNSSSLAKGTSKTYQNGKNGKKTITELVTYIDGKESYTTVISEKITQSPVNKIILVGTKSYTASSSGFTWPTRGAYSISSHYGYRSASISGWSFHGGTDIVKSGGGSSGIPVVAAASGVVEYTHSGYSGYGHTVVINHGGGIKTRYAHMYPGSICVRAGQNVSKGQQIGRIGSTGNSTGPHLHFEVLLNGSKVNPMRYIG
ncbi:MAG: M23 family metallopeptidase [Acutalibacteraceae bacterium]|nr:M23 family metallopeptidase [Acutalibacteraceae bacterium]